MTIEETRVTCEDCGEVADVELVVNAPLEVAIASMRAARCPHCGSHKLGLGGSYGDAPPLYAPIQQRADWWKQRGDVGISSETIWRVMLGVVPLPWPDSDVPCDPSDFKRCKKLLDLIPEWRQMLNSVADIHSRWIPFIANWEQLEYLYEQEAPTGKCPKLFKRIQELRATKVADRKVRQDRKRDAAPNSDSRDSGQQNEQE